MDDIHFLWSVTMIFFSYLRIMLICFTLRDKKLIKTFHIQVFQELLRTLSDTTTLLFSSAIHHLLEILIWNSAV